jgi:hypothetical protein
MKKYVKGDVSIHDSFNKNVSQKGLGSHGPHGTTAGSITYLPPMMHNTDLVSSHVAGFCTGYRLRHEWILRPLACADSELSKRQRFLHTV